MVGLIIKNQSFIAQTSRPLVVEPFEDYSSAKNLLPEYYIAISSKFVHSIGMDHTSHNEFPIYPNETWVQSETSNHQEHISFAVNKGEAGNFKKGTHLVSRLGKITSTFQSDSFQNVYLVCIQNQVVIFVRNKGNLEFVNVYQLNTAEEVLYWVNRLFRDKNLSFEEDQIIIYGEVKMKMDAFHLFKPYFRKIWIEDSNPFSEMV